MALNSATLNFAFTADITSALDLTTVSAPVSFARQLFFTLGAAANQIDKVFTDTITVAPSATTTLDLNGGLTDPFGTAMPLARIKGLYVAASPLNTNNVLVARPATNGVPLFSAVSVNIPLHPGGAFLWTVPSAAGVVVTAATGDLIDFTNSAAGTSVTFDVVIAGSST
jgi:hypothetical protein